jgi:hypothetical protein
MTDPTSPGGSGEAPCPAEEWHRDGRGLWAVRRCRNWHTQKGSPHSFTQWEYNAQPPGLTEQSRQQEAWQPIETAPKDVKVLMFAPKERLYTTETIKQQPDIAVDDIRVSATRHWAWATHWMPLPARPQPKEPR